MHTVPEATNLISQHLPDWGTIGLSLDNPRGGILAQSITTDRAYPPIDRVMMDGIAVQWKEYATGRREFAISATATTGTAPLVCKGHSTCIEVMTGAPLPLGCDLVIPYEHLEIKEGKASIVDPKPYSVFDHVHREASDVPAHIEVLKIGTYLQPIHWGILASLGYTEVKVKRSPRTLIVGTGDELVAPHIKPEPYQLRCSNIYALRSALEKYGYTGVEIIALTDEYEELKKHYSIATQNYEQIIYSGGISKGKRDFLPEVWVEMGVIGYVQGVKQRPGKPFYFGVDQRHGTIIFGLPGNPVSSLICLYRYVLGLELPLEPCWAKLTAPVVFHPPLTYFLPVKVSYDANAEILAEPRPVQNSGDFLGLADTDGFVELPSHQNEFPLGSCLPLYRW